MSEIKRELIHLPEGQVYVAGQENYVITEQHTLSDVVRFLIGQAGPDGHEEIQFLLDEYKPDSKPEYKYEDEDELQEVRGRYTSEFQEAITFAFNAARERKEG